MQLSHLQSASVDIVPESVIVLVKLHMVFTGLLEWISCLAWVKGILPLVSLGSDIHLWPYTHISCLAHTHVAVRAPPYVIIPLQPPVTEPETDPSHGVMFQPNRFFACSTSLDFPGSSLLCIHTKGGSISPFRARGHRSRFWLSLTRLQFYLEINSVFQSASLCSCPQSATTNLMAWECHLTRLFEALRHLCKSPQMRGSIFKPDCLYSLLSVPVK